MPETLALSAIVATTPADLYAAWLDSDRHSAMTGGRAQVDAKVGGLYSAWDGYIEGAILDLQPGLRIVQSWRAADFPRGAPPSRLEITLLAVAAGTRFTLAHTGIPDGQGSKYEAGWEKFYLSP